MKTSQSFFKSLLFCLFFISKHGLALDVDNLGIDCTAIAQESNITSIRGEKWSRVYSLREFGGGGCPIKAVGAIVPYPGRNWFILFEKDTDRYTYYKADEKAWTGVFRTHQFGKGICPFDKIEAAYTFNSQGKDKIRLFDAESSNYVDYLDKPAPACTTESDFESSFTGGGAPFTHVGAAVPYPGRNWLIFFEKGTDQYTYYNNDKRAWVGSYRLNQFGSGGCPFSSIGAAMPYGKGENQKILLFDDSGKEYVYYDDKGSLMLSQLRELDSTIVVIRSHRWDGAYVELASNGGAGVREVPRSKLLGTKEIKLILHHIEGNIVCFESLKSPDHYLDMVHDRYARFTLSNEIPENKDWARFSIHGDALNNVGIRSERWGKDYWCDAHQGGGLVGTKHASNTRPTEDWGRFEIRFPAKITDEGYKVVATLTNGSTEPRSVPFQYTVGYSIGEENQDEDMVEISIEAEKNFGAGGVKFGSKYAHKWANSTSSTWNQSFSVSGDKVLQPGEVIYVKQLVANYGPLEFRRFDIKFDD